MTAQRLRGDSGSGLVSSLAGVGAFLAFLFLAVHVIVGLYATSVVTDAATDAARRVAGAATTDEDRPAAVAHAEGQIRAALGRMGDDAAIAWSFDGDSVGITVRVSRPGFVRMFGGATIERTVVVRREALG